jgi:hypothetical protein
MILLNQMSAIKHAIINPTIVIAAANINPDIKRIGINIRIDK